MRQLVEWSETLPLPLWQRDALRRLYISCPLTSTDADAIFKACKAQHSLLDDGETGNTPQPITVSDIPATTSTALAITLCSIAEVTHVNALADGQKVVFGPQGLTVVFGNNGSGKSGYARILKSVCRARSSEDILHNVYDNKPTVPASAKLRFAIGGAQQPDYQWNVGTPALPTLSLVSVFDSKCAAIHVDEKNEAAYTPLPLQILKELSDLCRGIKAKLQAHSTTLANQIPPALRDIKCSATTAAGKYLLAISGSTVYEEAERLAEVTASDLARLEELKTQLQADPQKALALEESRRTRLAAVVQRVERLATGLSDSALETYRQLLDAAAAKTEAARIAAGQAFTNEPLDGIGSSTWRALWDAARQYSENTAYPGIAFPKTDDSVCVLCQQPLQAEAVARFGRFDAFVKQAAQKAADQAMATLNTARQAFSANAVSQEQSDQDVAFVRDELALSAIAAELQSFYAAITLRRESVLQMQAGVPWVQPQILGASPVPALQQHALVIAGRVQELTKAQNPELRGKLEAELRELQDRSYLKSVLPDLKIEIARRKKLARIQAAIDETDTNKITRKSTELADSLITAAWRDQFAAEVSRMDIHHLRIELQREGGAYGAAKFRVALIRDNSIKLGAVLSEGEFRCIALAAFFAELATADAKSALVFDDPVSSLDHEHRDAVAKRLAEEAATGRQVIVFTHDVFFLDLISRHAKTNNASSRYLTVNRLPSGDRCGAVDDGVPPNVAPAEDLADGIYRQVKQFEGLHTSGRLVQWNAQTNSFSIQLRKCWERAVAEVLSPVVERFNAGVNTKNIWQIAALDDTDCIEMRRAYKRCSELNHEKCAELGRNDPTPMDYYTEITAVKTWIQGIRTKQTNAQNNHPTV